MPTPPVTRLQLDAYRFGQRRLESALVLRDPVPLHEQLRSQRRTVAVGVLFAVLLTCGLTAYVHLTGRGGLGGKAIVVNSQSGQMYVVIHQPDRLVPVGNLAAARLVLKAASNPGSGLTGLVGGSDSATAQPSQIEPAQLAGAQYTASSAVLGAPDTNLPGADTPLAGPAAWALCNNTTDGSTTVIDGVGPSTALGATEGLVVAHDGVDYLVTAGKKYQIGPGAAAAYDLKDQLVHPPVLAEGLFTLIPSGPELGALKLNIGAPVSRPGRLGVGDVVKVERPGQATRFYVLVAGGAAEVPEPVAKLLRAGRGEDLSQPAPALTVEQINGYNTRVSLAGVADYPGYLPTIRTGPAASVLCWQWDARGRNPRVTLAPALPAPADQPATRLAQADGPGPKLDTVSVPGGAAIAGSAVPGSDPTAPRGYWLVSTTGVAYPIADVDTARALGVSAPVDVPVDALTALVQGHPLALSDATRTVDVYRQNPATGATTP